MSRSKTEEQSLTPSAPRTASLDWYPLAPADVVGNISIDRNYGLHQTGGDKALFQELLHDFLAQYGNICTELEESLISGQHETTNRLLHGLTGVAGTLGVTNLYHIATELTIALHQEQPWQQVFERLRAEMNQVSDSITTGDNDTTRGEK